MILGGWPGDKRYLTQRVPHGVWYVTVDVPRSYQAALGRKRFTTYRRSVGVDDVTPGQRRSKVAFHSFRRWFVTSAKLLASLRPSLPE